MHVFVNDEIHDNNLEAMEDCKSALVKVNYENVLLRLDVILFV